MILILHGWGHKGKLWQKLANSLGKDAKAIDLPGFGTEPLISDNWGIPQYADWVAKKVKNEKNLILIGHSFGGRIAAEIASTNPNNLKALILSGSPCLYRPTSSTKLKINFYKSIKSFLPNSAKKIFYSKDLKSAGELERIFRKVVVYDQTKQLQRIKIPTLLIWGQNDDQVPLRIANEMKQLIKNTELKIIENTGHNIYLENPNLFYGYVKNFIDNIPNS